jgi:hypothetical protein
MDAHRLVGMEFNIPVFNAIKQKYKCDDVKMEHVPNGKHYRIYFDEIQSAGYSVPERMELILEFHFSNTAVIKTRLNEIPGNGSKHEIATLQIASDTLQSITQFKTFLGVLGRKTV